MVRRVKKKNGGMTKAQAKKYTSDMGSQKFTIDKPKPSLTKAQAKKYTSSMKNKKLPYQSGGKGKDTPLKKSQLMNTKGTVYTGKLADAMKKKNKPGAGSKLPKKVGALRRSNKMGGGMMKKRMKRGGRAK